MPDEMKPLFFEGGHLSLGRISWWIWFLPTVALEMATRGAWVVPAEWLGLGATLLAYNIAKKSRTFQGDICNSTPKQ